MKNLYVIIFLLCFYAQAQDDNFENYNQLISDIDHNIEMIAIEGGIFKMVKDDSEDYETSSRNIKINPFWMAKYEITWDIFNLFLSREIDSLQVRKSYKNEFNVDVDAVSGATAPYVDMSFGMGVEGYPAISMTQLTASKFCEWLTAMTGNYYRLPTEAEWEYAARGGLQGAMYPWGGPYTKNDRGCFMANFKPMRGDYAVDQALYTVEANAYDPNGYNLYNMAGNVSEWVDSSYEPEAYDFSITMNPNVNKSDNKKKIIRGGSWKDVKYFLQVSSRDYEYADQARSYIGFRTVNDYLGTDYSANAMTNTSVRRQNNRKSSIN